MLRFLDILVDGPFVLAQRNLDLLFRGSENQRILDVPKSLAAGRAVWCTAPRWVGKDRAEPARFASHAAVVKRKSRSCQCIGSSCFLIINGPALPPLSAAIHQLRHFLYSLQWERRFAQRLHGNAHQLHRGVVCGHTV